MNVPIEMILSRYETLHVDALIQDKYIIDAMQYRIWVIWCMISVCGNQSAHSKQCSAQLESHWAGPKVDLADAWWDSGNTELKWCFLHENYVTVTEWTRTLFCWTDFLFTWYKDVGWVHRNYPMYCSAGIVGLGKRACWLMNLQYSSCWQFIHRFIAGGHFCDLSNSRWAIIDDVCTK